MSIFKNQFNRFAHGIVKHVRQGVAIGNHALHTVGKASNSIIKANDSVGRMYKQAKHYVVNKAKGTMFEDPLHNAIFGLEHSPVGAMVRDTRDNVRDYAKELGRQAGKASKSLSLGGNKAISNISSHIVPTTTTGSQALAFVNS